MSVNWSVYSSVAKTLEGREDYGVVSLTAGLSWFLKQDVEYTPHSENTAHTEIVGKKTGSVKNKFKKAVARLHSPIG